MNGSLYNHSCGMIIFYTKIKYDFGRIWPLTYTCILETILVGWGGVVVARSSISRAMLWNIMDNRIGIIGKGNVDIYISILVTISDNAGPITGVSLISNTFIRQVITSKLLMYHLVPVSQLPFWWHWNGLALLWGMVSQVPMNVTVLFGKSLFMSSLSCYPRYCLVVAKEYRIQRENGFITCSKM